MEFLLHLKSKEPKYKKLDTLWVAVSQANWPMISLLISLGGKMYGEEKTEEKVHVYGKVEAKAASKAAKKKVKKGRASKRPVGDVAAQYPLYHYLLALRRGAGGVQRKKKTGR